MAWQGEPLEFGRRVTKVEAQRQGLGKTQNVYVVADGGVWIWNVQRDRFQEATRRAGLLSRQPASVDGGASALPRTMSHTLARFGGTAVDSVTAWAGKPHLQTLTDLPAWCEQRDKPVPPEQSNGRRNTSTTIRILIHYQAVEARGRPVGSGAMESFCARTGRRPPQTLRPVLEPIRLRRPPGPGDRPQKLRLGLASGPKIRYYVSSCTPGVWPPPFAH